MTKNIQYATITPPPKELIDCTNFVIDFAGRKFIHVGLDGSDDLNVMVQIITPSRYVCITSALLHKMFNIIPYILSTISHQNGKQRDRFFLKDEDYSLSRRNYRLECMLVVKSNHRDELAMLNRQDLLRIQEIQWAISESISHKFNVVRCSVKDQIDKLATHLSTNVYVDTSLTVEQMCMATRNIHNNLHVMNIFPNSENSFINQIKLYAEKQLAVQWANNIKYNDMYRVTIGYGDNETPDVIIINN
ncbi:PREDICTED: uncharacterized protein LOC107170649 [Diuraphis noxia]|uniref:uncharacterized protein LOC107170649 n=1 Tax=Diuraphis noxia TaxID=143948 RepID=UPI0007635647|nr:PREDICTED: uncharacterized protein LOC107170649 [Diuraphis noxia]